MTRRSLLATLSALTSLPLVGPALAKLAPAPPEITTLAAATARNAEKAAQFYSAPLAHQITQEEVDALETQIQQRLNQSWYDHFKNDFLYGSPGPGQKPAGILANHPDEDQPKSAP